MWTPLYIVAINVLSILLMVCWFDKWKHKRQQRRERLLNTLKENPWYIRQFSISELRLIGYQEVIRTITNHTCQEVREKVCEHHRWNHQGVRSTANKDQKDSSSKSRR